MLERYFNFCLNELSIGSFQQTDICSNSHLPTTNNDGGDVVEEVEDSGGPEGNDDDVAPVRQLSYPMYQK